MHAAGVLEDGLVASLSTEQLRRVFHPKAEAAWILHELTIGIPLDFFVLCSSAASVLGAGGQGAYAAANASLDALAHYRRSIDLPAVAFNSGPWAGQGMAHKATKIRGIEPIEPETGAALLIANRNSPFTQLIAIDADWSRVAERMVTRSAAILRDLLSKPAKNLHAELAGLYGAARNEYLQLWIQERVGVVLGLESGRLPSRTQGFFDMGFDSLLTVELRNLIQADFPSALPTTLTFEYPTVTDLADYLCRTLDSSSLSAKDPAGKDSDNLLDELELLEAVLVRN